MRVGFALFLLLGVIGCRAAFKSSQGGATAPSGRSGGTTNSLVFGDEGGVLSRAGMGTIGVGLAGLGSIRPISSTTTTERVGDNIVTTKTDTAEINTEGAKPGMNLVDAANDPNANLSALGGGLASNLEIAGETLGGDTRGWQYDIGLALRQFRRGPVLTFGWRGYAGLGYGSFELHDRQIEPRADRGPPMMSDETYKFLGLTTRFGAWAFVKPGGLMSVLGFEVFGKAVLNALGPHAIGVGQRVQWQLVFLEMSVMQSSLGGDHRSISLELGLGI